MSEPVTFDNRVVIVTGAGGGLGRAYAAMLATRGARVVVNDLRNAAPVAEELIAQGGLAVPDDHDIATDEGAQGIVDHAIQAYGRIDAIVNNAGIFPLRRFPEMPWDVFDAMQKVHVYGPYFVTKYAWRHLIDSGHGRVVLVSARAALYAETADLSHYGAAKGAILGLTRQLAHEGAPHGIAVNAILPSAFTYDDHPRAASFAHQIGIDPTDREQLATRSTELAAAVVTWLCHPDCSANGEFVRAHVGEVRRASFSMSRGIDDPHLTVETVRDRFDEIMDSDGAEILPALWEATSSRPTGDPHDR
jgi:NAD(P)-dependent dehydrogenase (short-subunit alcohol dehydrogenase family)